jgi:hypothetical protein
MVLDWRTAEQGFEIVEIAEKNNARMTLWAMMRIRTPSTI